MRTLIAGLVALTALTALATSARAATFVVNETEDVQAGSCDVTIGGCTLREAILAAVATAGRDTIRFDPAVFPPGAGVRARVASALPVIADPAGTVVDGAGAGVEIVFAPPNGGVAGVNGLVFASAPGVALAKPMVANLAVRFFSGSGIVFCGGTLPGCDEDLSGVVVQNVVASQNGGDGIDIDGKVDTKIAIVGAVTAWNDGSGIYINGGQMLNGISIERSTADHNDGSGFGLNAAGDTVGVVITDAVVVANRGSGVDVNASQRNIKTKIANFVASGNLSTGVRVNGGVAVTAAAISNVLASQNVTTGIDVSAGDLVTAALKDVTASYNGYSGIYFSSGGAVAGTTITRAVASGNQNIGIHLSNARGVQIRRAVATRNGDDGVYLEGSQSGVKDVRASGNGGAGIRLDSPGSGNTIEKSSFNANDGDAGLYVAAGNTGNVIAKNTSLANDGSDIFDANPSCSNEYTKNVFRTGDVECQ